MSYGTESAGGRAFPRLHWGAVVAGVLVAVAGHVALGLVGAALGLEAAAGSQALGAGAALWGIATPFVATAAGAWLACRLAAAAEPRAAGLHGVLVWCVGLVAGAVFLAGTVATVAPDPAGWDAGFGQALPDDALGRSGAAAAASGAALAALSGLLGAVAGAALAARRGEGRALGWRIAIQRREERRQPGPAGERSQERGYARGAYPGVEERPRPGEPPAGTGAPGDPYHH